MDFTLPDTALAVRDGVRDVAASEAFYSTIARHTGLRPGTRTDERVQFRGPWATFSLVSDGRPQTEHAHIAFTAPDRRTVDEFHAVAQLPPPLPPVDDALGEVLGEALVGGGPLGGVEPANSASYWSPDASMPRPRASPATSQGRPA